MAPKIDPKVGYFGSTQKATLNKDFDNYSIPVTRIFRIHHPNRIFILSKKYTLITYFLFSLKKHTLFLDFCCFWHPKHSLRLSVKNYPFPCFCIRAWYPHWIQVCPPPALNSIQGDGTSMCEFKLFKQWAKSKTCFCGRNLGVIFSCPEFPVVRLDTMVRPGG